MSKRLVLFSQPTAEVWEKLNTVLFPAYLGGRILAYMPCEGDETELNAQFLPLWETFAAKNNAQLVVIDNSKRGSEAENEIEKLKTANVLMITGGNTFKLLNHLRESGLGKAIKEFWQKGNVVLSGFSAGAVILTPSIQTARIYGDVNEPGLSDLSALGIVDFEVWAHFEPSQAKAADEYRQIINHGLKLITNQEIVVIDI